MGLFNKKELAKIEELEKENHDKLIEFIKIPDAEQYRESLILKQDKEENKFK